MDFSSRLTDFSWKPTEAQPVDAATRGVFFAGCAEGPKDIKESVTQGSAAAARIVRLLHSGEMLSDPITAEVIPEKCKICGICAEVCPYGAISLDVQRKIVASVTSRPVRVMAAVPPNAPSIRL